tara:strand:+ start:223 stop:1113 length:891 start_codon:yes stop_codon:yes gene_type:complete
MAASDFTLITNASHPAYSEECDSYLNPGSAKARRLFIKGSPSPRQGISAFYCLTKAGFAALDNDSISIRMSFQNHYDTTNSTNPGKIGLFLCADKARLQAAADANSTANYNAEDVMGDKVFGLSTITDMNNGRNSQFRIGKNQSDSGNLPADTDGPDDHWSVKTAGDYKHMRMDFIVYDDNGVKKVKCKHYASKRNVAYPANEAAWEGADFSMKENTSLWTNIFDKDNDGVLGETSWSEGDPIEGALTNSASQATEAVCGFLWRQGDRADSQQSDQDYQPQVTIGRFECLVKSDTI